MRIRIKQLKQIENSKHPLINSDVLVKGWVRTARKQKSFSFVELNDGSTLSNLQIIINDDMPDYEELMEKISTGASLSIKGKLVESPGANQAVELHANEILDIGECCKEEYPLQKKRHSFEFLRTIAHLRPRTNALGALARVRNALSYATHKFFQKNGFLYIHSPIITSSDCEGAGELFQVTTLENRCQKCNKSEGKDFFGKPTYLTVSGQFNAEIFACALSDVYTFGPTFRAENSNTARHLAEFWMIEPEMAFADLNDDIDCAEKYLKYIVNYTLEHCKEDLQLFDKFIEKGLLNRLQQVVDSDFAKVTYTEAVDILKKSKKSFEFPVEWGADLQSEHERYLTEEHFKKPVFVIDYPEKIKSFYMKDNDDGKTVAAMDLLVPKVGEIIGGSQREDRLDRLEKKIEAKGMKKEDYWWYLELRKYGSVPHSGFGLGLERLVQFTTGMENIRDVIPFPRYPGHAEF